MPNPPPSVGKLGTPYKQDAQLIPTERILFQSTRVAIFNRVSPPSQLQTAHPLTWRPHVWTDAKRHLSSFTSSCPRTWFCGVVELNQKRLAIMKTKAGRLLGISPGSFRHQLGESSDHHRPSPELSSSSHQQTALSSLCWLLIKHVQMLLLLKTIKPS